MFVQQEQKIWFDFVFCLVFLLTVKFEQDKRYFRDKMKSFLILESKKEKIYSGWNRGQARENLGNITYNVVTAAQPFHLKTSYFYFIYYSFYIYICVFTYSIYTYIMFCILKSIIQCRKYNVGSARPNNTV